jgi:hypothetical protein
MRTFTSFTIATLLAATLMAGPVLANDTGHHTKQSDPSYWAPDSAPATTTKAANNETAKDQVSKAPVEELRSGGYRHDRNDQPESATGDVR